MIRVKVTWLFLAPVWIRDRHLRLTAFEMLDCKDYFYLYRK